MAQDDPLPPELRARFQLRGSLGEGGFGSVHRCHDRDLGRDAAVKVLRVLDPEAQERFRREASLTAAIRHPNVVEVYDFGLAGDGTPYLVYEVIEGETLRGRVATRGSLPTGEVLELARQGAAALAELHRNEVVHRDVKPANVMVTPEDRLVLLDFGLAKLAEGGSTVTQDGLLLGTPPFMAPELWRGEPPSPASDQFAWAATLHEVLTGEVVYPGTSPGEILDALGRGWEPPPPPVAGPLGHAIARGLAPAPGDRFPDMDHFLEALEGVDPAPSPPGTGHAGTPGDPGATRIVAAAPFLQEESAPPRASRPGAAALLVLATLGLGAWALGGPGAGPPSPEAPRPAPDAPAPREAAWRELCAAEAELARSFLPTGSIPTEPFLRENFEVEDRIAILLDPALPARWERVLARALAWTREGASAAPGDAGATRTFRRRVDRVVGSLRPLAQAIDDLDSSSFGRDLLLKERVRDAQPVRMEDLVAAIRTWKETTEKVLDAGPRGPPGIAEAYLLAELPLRFLPDRRASLLPALTEAVRKPPDSWSLERAVLALSELLREPYRADEAPCATRGAAYEALASALVNRAELEPMTRAIFLMDAVGLWALLAAACPGAPPGGGPGPRFAHLERSLEEVEAGRRAPPEDATANLAGIARRTAAALDRLPRPARAAWAPALIRARARALRLAAWSQLPSPASPPPDAPELPTSTGKERAVWLAASALEAAVLGTRSADPLRQLRARPLRESPAWIVRPRSGVLLREFLDAVADLGIEIDEAGRWREPRQDRAEYNHAWFRFSIEVFLRDLLEALEPPRTRGPDSEAALRTEVGEAACAAATRLLAEGAAPERLALGLQVAAACGDLELAGWVRRVVRGLAAEEERSRLGRVTSSLENASRTRREWFPRRCEDSGELLGGALAIVRGRGGALGEWPDPIKPIRAVRLYLEGTRGCPPLPATGLPPPEFFLGLIPARFSAGHRAKVLDHLDQLSRHARERLVAEEDRPVLEAIEELRKAFDER